MACHSLGGDARGRRSHPLDDLIKPASNSSTETASVWKQRSSPPLEVLLVIGALLPIVNPLGNAPIFLAMTSWGSTEMRQVLAWRIAVNAFTLLLVSIFIGSHILAFFGISVPIVQVGGGLLVAAAGWRLLELVETN